MIDPPVSEAERERWRKEHQPCSECEREPWKGHWPWCSKAETAVRERYSEYEQRVRYRIEARELGCRCPDTLGAHTHNPSCDLYETPAQMSERLEEEHEPRLREDVEREIDAENRAIRGIEGKFR